MIDLIGFDADDTLWYSEIHYTNTKQSFAELFKDYFDPVEIGSVLDEIEMRNIHIFGFGIKSYTLSLIETAIEITNGKLQADHIRQILLLSKQMLEADIQLFDQVEETLAELSKAHDLILITKGDTFEQGKKIARSGVSKYFKFVEVVGAKTPQIYASLLEKYGVDPSRFLMVGNALKSDILPVLELGGMAVYIHYEATWAHENEVSVPLENDRYYEIERIDQMQSLIGSIVKKRA